MPSFEQRSYRKELLDKEDLSFEDIRKNMQELDVINHRLGGHKVTIQGLNLLLKESTYPAPLEAVEIGCGGGDNLRVIRKWADDHHIAIHLTGVDINENCVRYASSLQANEGIEFICADYRNVRFERPPDIVFSSLFCHHFTNAELVFMLRWMKDRSRVGFFINDLHRHPLAYYSIRLLTQLFSRSYLVKNDAPLSVQRGFRKKDWEQLFAEAGIDNFNCRWKWAFRWLITCRQ